MVASGKNSEVNRQLSLPRMRDPLIAVLTSVAPERVAIADALGAVLAKPVQAPRSIPSGAIALRAGYAVIALDLVGASPHSPVMLGVAPPRVMPGDTLPSGCDAIVPADAVHNEGAFVEITQSPAPGEFVRLAGHDLAPEVLLADRGTQILPRLQLAMMLAGIEAVEIIRPCIALPAVPQPECVWLAETLMALGCTTIGETEAQTAHLVLGWSEGLAATLALHPGEATTTCLEPGMPPHILLPRRFDGMIAGFFALILPAIERLTGRRLATLTRPLARKITSGVGITDVALLKTTPDGFLPLTTGEITLAALTEADALALIPAESEGFAAGALLSAISLDFIPLQAGASQP